MTIFRLAVPFGDLLHPTVSATWPVVAE